MNKKEKTTRTFWLVSVSGPYTPADETVSVPIELFDDETPIDWFADRPKVYHRFEFVPCVLLNFWKITKKQFKELNDR